MRGIGRVGRERIATQRRDNGRHRTVPNGSDDYLDPCGSGGMVRCHPGGRGTLSGKRGISTDDDGQGIAGTTTYTPNGVVLAEGVCNGFACAYTGGVGCPVPDLQYQDFG